MIMVFDYLETFHAHNFLVPFFQVLIHIKGGQHIKSVCVWGWGWGRGGLKFMLLFRINIY